MRVCVCMGTDIKDPDEKYQKFSNRPDAAVLSYPVITSGKYAHRDSFVASVWKESYKKRAGIYVN